MLGQDVVITHVPQYCSDIHAIVYTYHISTDSSTFYPLYAVIFDPACFYGHHEFDLAIAGMFGGFNKQFYDAYHSLIPKAPGFAIRHKLYTLFHYINHW